MNQRSLPEVRFGPILESDLPILRAWRNDYTTYKWCRQYEPIGEKEHLAWFESLHGDTSRKMYAIYKTKTAEIIGVCGLTSIDWINRRAEFSLYIAPDRKGHGYGEAALRRLLSVGFSVLNLNCIWGESFDGNPAINMFSRVGFKCEGVRREFYYRDGKYISASLWSILKHEFI